MARVVELFIGDRHSGRVSLETISFFGIQSILDSVPLLPRLTSLGLTRGLGYADAPAILALLSPKITTLTLVLPHYHNILFQPILSVISDRCRWLQELVLISDSPIPHPPNAVEGLITACWDTLRTLEIRPSSGTEYLLMTVNLPRLRSLKLERVQIPRDLPSSVFPSLEELIILNFFGGPLQRFFKSFCTFDLKVLKIHGFHVIPLKESMAALSRFSASLEVLEISNLINLNLPSADIPRILFTNLKTLYVGCPGWVDRIHDLCSPFRPNDNSIAELGAAVPNLTHLTLGSPTCPRLGCVTFLSLVSLSKTCRDLETLTIRVDFRSMVAPSPPESEDVETSSTFDATQGNACRLRNLVVGLSILPNHPDSEWVVAIGLEKLFPSLSEVVGLEQGVWGKVRGNIGVLHRTHRTVQC